MWPPRTLAITDSRRFAARDERDEDTTLVAFVAALAAAGVDAVQLREHDWPDGRLVQVARRARQALDGSGCRLFVNDRAHVAVAAGADGVHLRGNGMPAARVRRVWPEHLLIGRSMHVGDAREDATAVDLVMFGTVFPSASKGPDAPIAGVSALAEWTQQAGMPPVVAVGGITVDRCESARRAGASGVAGIELFVRAWQQGAASLASLVTEIHAVFRDGERAL